MGISSKLAEAKGGPPPYSLKLFDGTEPHGAALVIKGMGGSYAVVAMTKHVEYEVEATTIYDVFSDGPVEMIDGKLVEHDYCIMLFHYNCFDEWESGIRECEFDFDGCVPLTLQQVLEHESGECPLWKEHDPEDEYDGDNQVSM